MAEKWAHTSLAQTVRERARGGVGREHGNEGEGEGKLHICPELVDASWVGCLLGSWG